ncbi:MAG: HAD hydrolase-like protein [Bacteroidales bacterium]|jgi:FMN phosphatase YigB (HAD superfamily)|nr:HAD hydrolase-like protein [Bacteroidales bacterium]
MNKKVIGIIGRADVLMFDLDGVLVATNYANFLSYLKAIQQLIQSDIDLTYESNKRFTRETLKRVIPTISKNKFEEIIELKNKFYIEYLNETKLNYSVVKILNEYSNTKKMVLVTNSHKERAIVTLEYHGVMDKFNHRFYRQDTQCSNKYEYALSFLQIPPASMVIFENENSEIDSAILAGIPENNIISIEFITLKNNNYVHIYNFPQ